MKKRKQKETKELTNIDYLRIYEVINAIAESEKMNTSESCLFFSILGMAILRHHYNIEAYIECGVCVYNLGSKNNLILCDLKEFEKGNMSSGSGGFHFVVVTEKSFIDFMSPNFPKIDSSFPSLIINKDINELKKDINELDDKKGFFFIPNKELRNKLVEDHFKGYVLTDLINMANEWFEKPPKKMIKELSSFDNKGNERKIILRNHNIEGSL